MKNQKGIGLLMTVLGMLSMLVAFLYVSTYVSQSMLSQLSKTKRQVAGYLAMQDFAVLAQNAYQTYQFNSGTCPAGTTQIPAGKPFCWPDATVENPHCIYHPLAGPTSGSPRLICLNGSGPEKMEVISKKDQKQSVPWWKWLWSGFTGTVEAANEAHTPALTGAPTISYASTPNCSSSFNSTYCKMCQTVGGQTQNLNCIYLRVCMRNIACDEATNDDWTMQRLGMQIF